MSKHLTGSGIGLVLIGEVTMPKVFSVKNISVFLDHLFCNPHFETFSNITMYSAVFQVKLS